MLHDVLITVGVFSLLGRELTLPLVGAILTIAGYSINDTIVVYDRIREGLASGRRGTIEQIMNESINQTLSRTILTSSVTLIPISVPVLPRRRGPARFLARDHHRRRGRHLFVDLHRLADRALVDPCARREREQFAPRSDAEKRRHNADGVGQANLQAAQEVGWPDSIWVCDLDRLRRR